MQRAAHHCAHFLALTVAGTLTASAAHAVTLYDAALGTTPSAQGWTLGTSGTTAGTQAVGGGVYTLNSTAADAGYGNGRVSPVPLNTLTGFELSFSLQVASETHTDTQRAGYSLIVVGSDPTRALELAFWTGNIWAYDYAAGQADPFQHGIDVAFNTAGALRTYTLAVSNQQFTLSSGGTALLSGALRNYTPSGIFPYVVPNALFFGDDTSRASAVTQMGFIAVTSVPEPAPAALLAAGLTAGLAALAWRRRAGMR